MSRSRMLRDVRERLVDAGGRTAQDLGLGRIVGQMLVRLYLSPAECSLDEIGADLGLSKAAVSIAARRLESLGLVRRIRKPGDRKSYYRTADNIATALHQGLLILVRNRMGMLQTELREAEELLKEAGTDSESAFVLGRVRRAQRLRSGAVRLLESPVVRFLTGLR